MSVSNGNGNLLLLSRLDEGAPPQNDELDLDDIRLVLGNVEAGQKQSLLADENAFRDFVQQEAAKLALLKAARANNVDKDPNTRFLMQRSANNVVREVYANQIITGKVPADFPTEAQMRQYYDQNKADFVVEQRIPVWQIFLPVGSAMGDKQVEEIETRARAISNDLKGNKVDFATAAFQNSAHQASAMNGGCGGRLGSPHGPTCLMTAASTGSFRIRYRRANW